MLNLVEAVPSIVKITYLSMASFLERLLLVTIL